MSEKAVGGVFVIRQEFGGGVIVNDDAEQQDKLKRAISQTQADERERIIRLLEEQIMKIETQIDLVSSDDGVSITFLTADIYNLNNYIALIKKENK